MILLLEMETGSLGDTCTHRADTLPAWPSYQVGRVGAATPALGSVVLLGFREWDHGVAGGGGGEGGFCS
jgi:hypothetical protein